MRWLIQQDKVAAILMSSSEEHLKSNVDVFDFGLSDEELEGVFELSR